MLDVKGLVICLCLLASTIASDPKDPSCDFEKDLCSWKQATSDDFDWTKNSGSTPSGSTGPSSGHGGKGYYVYIETSSPRVPYDRAILEFKGVNRKTVCLSFYYHMYGVHVKALNLYNGGNKIWNMKGDQGDSWKRAEVTISGDYDLKIEGVSGDSYQADIAIDDISVQDGSCGGIPPPPSLPPIPPTTQGPVSPQSCGKSPVSRVIGGVNANPGSWPWQIALLRGSGKSFSCGGSLITPEWVVTAAHCISRGQPGSYYTIRLGDHNRHVNEGTEEDIPAKRVIVHPDYNKIPIDSDIALIQLSKPATLNARVKTVCLPSQDEVVPTSSRCFITGWGKIKHPGSSHHILQQANLPPVTNSECAKKLASSPGGSSLQITQNMICAGVSGTILSGCHGDSGGPYVCQTSAGNWVLQGAVSWGSPRCSAAERYTVFARVGKFRNWIDHNMNSGIIPPTTIPPPQPTTTKAPATPTTASNSGPSCDFEKDLCSWKQETTDDFDWTQNSGSTPSSGTGPSSGHGGKGSYIYIETSSPRIQYETAILTFDGTNLKPVVCLTFYYHMYGNYINELLLNNRGKNVWKLAGDQGDQWKKAQVTLTGNYQLVFIASVGGSYEGDIAIDDISVSDGNCFVVPPSPSLPATRPPTPSQGPSVLPGKNPSCDFEKDLCSWKQATSDDFDWTKNSGSTPSSGTGPSSGHGGKGSYIYIETSSPRIQDETAILTFDGANPKPVVCLTFYYHMYGNYINELLLNNRGKNVWKLAGDQGDQWKKAQVTLTGNFQLVFTASVGSSYEGDIAIDDISVSDGNCFVVPPSPSLPATPSLTPSQGPSVLPGKCGFRPSTRIVGGQEASVNGWPWQAMLRYKYGGQFCGGTLVDPLWVVTAAHCVKNAQPTGIIVRMGAHYRVSGTVGTEQDIDVAQIINHESYHTPLRYSYDIALLKLARPAKLQTGIGLACLSDSSLPLPIDDPNTKCWITGWGTLSSGGSQPNALMEASVPLVSKKRCLKGYPGKIHDSMLCAGLDQGGVDACQGDSGGPLVCKFNGRWYLEGATSWGYGCAAPNKYGVYAKVRYLRSWIDRNMNGGIIPPTTIPPPRLTTTQPPTTASNSDPSCDFEKDLCSWKQATSDDFDWTQNSGSTPSSGTGPSSGHGGKGYYVYIETSSPRVPYDRASLKFKGVNRKTVCFSFYYHMYGVHVRALNLYNGGNKIWNMKGDQGDSWKRAEVTITGDYDLKIEGVSGDSYQADIAIDDITIQDGSCGGVPPSPSLPPIPPTTQGPVSPQSCGKSPVSRVIGGVNANPGSWPWQIALLRGSGRSFSCGGSLITPEWVVTAAHCISRGQPGSYYTIRLGDHNRHVNEGTEEDIPAKRVIVHPDYNKIPIDSDIALIQLTKPATLNARVKTVCLPSQDEVVPTSSRCFITGWGKIKHPGSSHHILQQANLPPVTNSECAKKLASSPGGSSLQITQKMICAGVNGTILSGCHGDSGGPYVCQTSAGNWVLQGAVSWGSPRCSAAERYTVFARVGKFRNWIDQMMST